MLHINQKQFFQPFEDVVTDMFGPITLFNSSKSYGMVVICRSSKAVKLHVVENQTEEALRLALMSIWRQVRWPLRIHSDNGLNYVAVRSKMLEDVVPGTIPVTWTTSTPYGPWMNGLAERIVRLSKECLSRFSSTVKSQFQLQRRFIFVEYHSTGRGKMDISFRVG
ncbi:hypothetical protein BLOT_012456 [Blomia tropicalis]|nr:hypothetical protein BLOT_012456 [Blomia tropicalis]